MDSCKENSLNGGGWGGVGGCPQHLEGGKRVFWTQKTPMKGSQVFIWQNVVT